MDGGETTNSFAFNFFSSSSSSSGGGGKEEKRTETNANETTTTIQKPEAKQIYSRDVFEPVFAKAVDKETVEIFSSDEEEEGAKVLMLSIEKKIPPLGKEEVRMRVPTLDAVCKNNNEKPAKGAKTPRPSAASAYSLASHDLVKGKYEGGLKLWECAIDLTKYVVRERVVEAMVTLSTSKSFRVLELGCGHGVPGIASLMKRAKRWRKMVRILLFCAR